MATVQADGVEITVLVENQVDMLLPDRELGDGGHCVRNGLVEHFDQGRTPPQAENGISLLVTARHGRHSSTTLFDVGLTGSVLVHNLRALGVDASRVEHVVISHGHPDHFGGLYAFLDQVERSVPVATHTEAFLPRYAVMGDGRTSAYYNQAFTPPRSSATAGVPSSPGVRWTWAAACTPPGSSPAGCPSRDRSSRHRRTHQGSTRCARTAATASTRSTTSRAWSST